VPPQFDAFENIHPQQHVQQRRGPTSATWTCLVSARFLFCALLRCCLFFWCTFAG
jgi:hypothetical protein